MAARVTVLAGPARSGKTERLLARYRRELAQGAPGSTLWLAPTQRSAIDIRGRLLNAELPACLSPGVMTFAQFAEAVLAASSLTVSRIGPVEKRRLVERIVQRRHAAGTLAHFGPIAEKPGLVDLVAAFIGELKRLEVWPEDFRAACGKLGMSAKDRELADFYAEYQETLTRHQLYDAEGAFWSARALLKEGKWGPMAAVRLAVADGFTDFTRTQHEILALLAERAWELIVTLPWELPTGRAVLFAKSQGTLDRLRERHAGLVLEQADRPDPPAWPALAHVERELFGNPRASRPAEEKKSSGIEVLAAARQLGEVELVARRIKQLLTGGDDSGRPVRAGDVAVVFRSLADYAPLVREVFEEYGLPTAIETGMRLGDSPALKALVSLIRLVDEDWPFRDLLALLTNSFFRPGWPEATLTARMDTERIIRELQVPAGRQVLLDQVRRHQRPIEPAAGPASVPHEQARREHPRQQAATALTLLERLAKALDVLPEQATAMEWWQALEKLAEATGLAAFVRTGPGSQAAAHDKAAWGKLKDDLEAIDAFHRRIGEGSPRLTRRELLGWLAELAATEPLPVGHDETGRVRVLSAYSARALDIPYLFFAGLAEKSFPPARRDDPLYSEAETRRLREQNVPLLLRGDRTREEMLLFYEVLTRATRRLWLSYPALDEKGQDLLPSPYLAEVERACGEGRLKRHEERGLSPVLREGAVYSPTELRTRAVDEALTVDVASLAGLLRRHEVLGENVLAGLTATGERARRESFSQFEGLLLGQAARDDLLQRYGPERRWSASALEQYATCPFRFLMMDVLRVKPLSELELEADYGQPGTMVHAVLAHLHRRMVEAKTTPGRLDDAAFQEYLRDSLETLTTYADDPKSLAAALWAIDARLVHRWTRAYREQHKEYDKQWTECEPPPLPAHFEVSFGQEPPSDDPLSTKAPLRLGTDADPILIEGRIDRIDRGAAFGRQVFGVVDYKSGSSRGYKAAAPLDGSRLQLELYTIAAQEVLLAEERALPLAAGYWWVKKEGYKTWVRCHKADEGGLEPDESWQARRQAVEEKVRELVHGVRQGQFPVFSLDKECTGRCPFHTVCRVNHVRSLEKPWPEAKSQPETADRP